MMSSGEKILRDIASALITMIALATPGEASVTISNGTTQNMTCSAGVCSPTEPKAVLNVTDLENLLGSGATTVTTTGSGGVQAGDIFVSASLAWTSTNALTLDANRSLVIEQPVSVEGIAGLNLVFNTGGKGGPLEFRKQGHVAFANLSSSLSINGVVYAFVNSVTSLAGAVAANPAGSYALAQSYDARNDGTYSAAPVPTTLTGTIEGLGNAIENLRIKDDSNGSQGVALFLEVGAPGAVRDLALTKASVTGHGMKGGYPYKFIAALVSDNQGTVFGSYADGEVRQVGALTGQNVLGGLVGYNEPGGTIANSHSGNAIKAVQFYAGGLAGMNAGIIQNSYALGSVSGILDSGTVGGLVGLNSAGEITQSFATGEVKGIVGGGLVGDNGATIDQSYATGQVTAQFGTALGGLIGENSGTATQSYSAGAVEDTGYAGGFVGFDSSQTFTYCYWDTDSSGITSLSQGAGNIANDPGITGLSTMQLQSGLPDGFSPSVWAENASINNGLPYLIGNPPPH